MKHMEKNAVAVIGAGPGGLVSARWLAQHGFEPVLFEADASPGGQWNLSRASSATWPGMRTNTSRVMSAFSDLDHAADVSIYPRQDQMLAYLERYAAKFDLTRRIRCGTRVERLEAAPGDGWSIRSRTKHGIAEEVFRHVVVATGAQARPLTPDIPGIESFKGALGIAHTARYEGAARYNGRSVVVAGCSISALEIASDLAFSGAQVTSSYRRQRYIVPKLIAGVPAEHVLFNRAAALAGETLPPEVLAEGLKAAVMKAGGNPARFGAREPDANVFAAGVSQSQNFLPAVAEGRIVVRPWIECIDGEAVHFADGTHAKPDAILFGTGYGLSMPWLADDIAKALGHDGKGIDLFEHTFHPDLEGLAFVGLYNLVGPYLPVLELQARWIAYTLAGHCTRISRAQMEQGIEACRAMRVRHQQPVLHDLAVRLARHAGVEPDPARWPELERALLFGPLSPASFRLQGVDSLDDAPARTRAAAAAFGAITCADFMPEELQLRRLIMEKDQSLAA
ncbi:flavin-containing monooxygenase [Caballeronia hypogeia]|uniref:Flavin-containing monooxygenase n=1 Tax=Caballeronia hypogeia TaxID=1777140 RepID=A0A158AFE0_9BURK|nr:FAD-dependent oxidoreductase [Caballeronia hypogeia]SAK56430.1 flavin-containing monooxygenase [Caballeronia hypogeia]